MNHKNSKLILVTMIIIAAILAVPAGRVSAASADFSASGPTHILFASGATSAEVTGTLAANSKVQYILRAFYGQLLEVSLSASEGGTLAVTSLAGTTLSGVAGTGSSTSFRGYLPRTGNYILTISSGSKAISYSMDVMIPQRISFQWGTTSATLTGSLKAQTSHNYILRAAKDQWMDVTITPDAAANAPQVIVYGVDGTVLQSGMGEALSFHGLLPLSEDYFVTVRAGDKDVAFTMNVVIPARISFAAGATSAAYSGWLAAGQNQYYVLKGEKGQTLTLTATPGASLGLEIKGADGTTFNSGQIVGGTFSGKLPVSQDYFITVKAGVKAVRFSLQVALK